MAGLVRDKEEHYFVFPSATFPMTVAQIQERVISKKAFIMIEEDGELIGFANLYDDEERKRIFIGNLAISQAYRGQGNGEKLVHYMINLAREKYQVSEVGISVVSTNHKVRDWYIKLGFKPFSIEVLENMSFVHMLIKV